MAEQFEALESVLLEGLQTTAPAIAIAIYQGGECVLNRAYGVLDPQTQSGAVQTDTLFDLASITKLYTATAFLMQVADGLVKLDTPVVDVVPEFAGDGTPRPIGDLQDPHTLEMIPPDAETLAFSPVDPKAITFRHLLTHTGGLAPWRALYQITGQVPPLPGTPDPETHAVRLGRALAAIATYPLVDAPGQAVHYSDLGLILLGTGVTRLDNAVSLDAVIAQRILHPAGLTHTTFNPTNPQNCAPTEYDSRWRSRRCQGEVHDENACGLGGIAGHAGLFSTAGEVAQFGQLWLDALAGKGWLPLELARDAVAEHAVTGYERRGLGWALRTPAAGVSSSGQYFSANSIGHTGFTGTSLWLDPQRGVSVALMTNRVYHGRDSDAIIRFRPMVHDSIVTSL
jgi:CubicO group peptidase (beta-lactamase class C family)